MCISVHLHIYVARYSWRTEECVRSLGSGVTYGWALPCGCWELCPGPLRAWALLTAEPSFSGPWLSDDGKLLICPTQVSALGSSLCLKLLLYLCTYECVRVMYVCVCIYMCACAFIRAHVWTCVQVRGVNVETMGQHRMSSAITSFCEPVSLTEPRTHHVPGWLVSKPWGSTCLHLPRAEGTGKRCLIWLCTWALEDELRSSCWHSQHFTLPHPCDLFM